MVIGHVAFALQADSQQPIQRKVFSNPPQRLMTLGTSPRLRKLAERYPVTTADRPFHNAMELFGFIG
ncbi:hypothetical protein MJO28_002409 [Puccinia striiformis f. sp. tritici]|uniref:Uncharacterized protein n=1 Tax=Puccinia striiformis f. sp. tritici TaxID=168172 RepID=A0ACC0EQY8_9BASI|nr:hypothetical protein Pst134EB_006690 [Puccinia striiformis f. sp. tritici]KAI7958618.1 hypothetical protein MJO28_002409 [Puccinia striiformis f. sp. tritici]